MSEQAPRRRLAAILAADVVGYSRMMQADEASTLAALKSRRTEILQPLISKHHGRIVKLMGDGVLVEFASAVEAVECAIKLQDAMTAANASLPEDHRIVLRIGINPGDVIVEGSDLYGDGVNIAARLESLTEPGGMCISGSVHDQVKRKLHLDFEDIGPQTVKNMADPVLVYRVLSGVPEKRGRGNTEHATLPLPTAPSIAVLPFINMSSDPEHEFFADGLTDDLITDLSKAAGLFVIARNTSFAYKGKSVDVRSIARNLGVRYVLEGSARRAAGRVRINVQLIDAIAGGHIWAERFDRALEDVFSVQDEVTSKIVEALVGRLRAPMPDRKRPSNMEAYDLCVHGRTLLLQSPQGAREARLMFERAITLDPEFAEAHRWLALSWSAGWQLAGEPRETNLQLAVEAAQNALALDPNDASARSVNATLLADRCRWDESEAEFAVAVKLDPNNADAWAMRSDLMLLSGRPTEALADIQKALRLNPHPPGWYYWFQGQAHYLNRQYDRAVQTLRREETYRTPSRRILAASLAQLGRVDEAHREAAMFMASNQHFTIRNWDEAQAFRDEAARQHFVDGYRKAGLPE
jgi:TolB-like protein/class 3 adenylate cyclase/Flp pilus assembly protein TadD